MTIWKMMLVSRQELQNTRKVLERVPMRSGREAHTQVGKRSVGAGHIATMPGWTA